MQVERSKPLALTGPEEPSIVEVLAAYEEKGYTGQFSSGADGMVRCHACDETSAAEQVPLLTTHRLEGCSDPEDESVVVGLECPACGELGTMVLPYGPGAGMEDAAVLAALLDDRDHSGVRPGT